MTVPLVIYHDRCADGFSAAWAVRLAKPLYEFYPATHGTPPPLDKVRGRDVYLVDFCYKRPDMERLLEVADRVTVLDHHKSAVEDNHDLMFRGHNGKQLHGIFDMDRSGAGITWDWFHPGVPRPDLLDRVEDRDIWRFRYPNTKDVQAALFSYEYTFENWDRLMLETPIEELEAEGKAIMRKHMKDIHELIDAAVQRRTIAGFEVPVLNAPYFFSSEAGHIICEGESFAACYYDAPDGRRFSLRSTDAGQDVSVIAKRFGGGGHRNAAGFTVPYNGGDFHWYQVA